MLKFFVSIAINVQTFYIIILIIQLSHRNYFRSVSSYIAIKQSFTSSVIISVDDSIFDKRCFRSTYLLVGILICHSEKKYS